MYEAALATLARPTAFSVTTREAQLAALVFGAMARWQLGRPEEARAALAALRYVLEAASWTATDGDQELLRAAEGLIEGKAAAAPR